MDKELLLDTLRFSDLDSICRRWPKTSKKSMMAVSGYIPIKDFDRLEPVLRPIMRANGLKAIYRGPRINNIISTHYSPTMTRRMDAEYAVLYNY